MNRFTDALINVTTKTHKDGYKIVRANVARTGIQSYTRAELGDAAPMGDPKDVLKIYRPHDEVFSDAALNGWAHVPVTLDHPDELVTPDNYAEYAVGEVSSRARVGDDGWLGLEFIVKDRRAMDASVTTHKQYSGGYTADIDFTPGVTPDGKEYDGVQRNINPNHLALVPRGRAYGKDAADNVSKNWGATPLTVTDNEDEELNIVKIMVGDKAISVDASDADKFKAILDAHAAEVEGLKTELAAVKIEAADANKLVKSDEEIAKLVDAAVLERATVADKARELVKDYDATGKDAMTMRREVIAKVYGDEAVADLTTDAEIKAAFAVARSVAKADPVLDAMKEKTKKKSAWEGMYKEKDEK